MMMAVRLENRLAQPFSGLQGADFRISMSNSTMSVRPVWCVPAIVVRSPLLNHIAFRSKRRAACPVHFIVIYNEQPAM